MIGFGMIDKNNMHIANRKTLFQGNYLNLEKLDILLPDGRNGEREIVRVKDAVAVLPMDQLGKVYLVKQYRHAIQKELIEVPAGLVDKNEKPEDTAYRECEEETGFRPKKLVRLLHYSHAEGYSTGFTTLYLGMDLMYTGKIHLDSSEYLQMVQMPFSKLLEMVKKNQILDSKTILCALLYEITKC
jgi:ADP-ribose pyrophosphatase